MGDRGWDLRHRAGFFQGGGGSGSRGFWCEVLGIQQKEEHEIKGVRIHCRKCGRTVDTAV